MIMQRSDGVLFGVVGEDTHYYRLQQVKTGVPRYYTYAERIFGCTFSPLYPDVIEVDRLSEEYTVCT